MKPEPSQEIVRKFFTYDPETGIMKRAFHPRKQFQDKNLGTRPKNTKQRYLFALILNSRYRIHRLAWIYVNGAIPEGMEIDHINGDGFDNRICNLRVASKSENAWNQAKPSNNKSGYKGVSWDSIRCKWRARISAHGKAHMLGYFDNPDDANRALISKREELHGTFHKHK